MKCEQSSMEMDLVEVLERGESGSAVSAPIPSRYKKASCQRFHTMVRPLSTITSTTKILAGAPLPCPGAFCRFYCRSYCRLWLPFMVAVLQAQTLPLYSGFTGFAGRGFKLVRMDASGHRQTREEERREKTNSRLKPVKGMSRLCASLQRLQFRPLHRRRRLHRVCRIREFRRQGKISETWRQWRMAPHRQF